MIGGDSKSVNNIDTCDLTPSQIWERVVMDSAHLWQMYGDNFD